MTFCPIKSSFASSASSVSRPCAHAASCFVLAPAFLGSQNASLESILRMPWLRLYRPVVRAVMLSVAPEIFAGEYDTCGDGGREGKKKTPPAVAVAKKTIPPRAPPELDAAAATPRTERRLDLNPLRDILEARADRDAAVDGQRVARDVARRRI